MILDIDPEVAQQLQATQTTYHQNRVIGTGNYEALIRDMFDEFEQTEREQGFGVHRATTEDPGRSSPDWRCSHGSRQQLPRL